MAQDQKSTVVTCANCGQRPGVVKWVGDGGAMALVHGGYTMWCQICTLEAQLVHARARVAAIPGLEDDLARAWAEDRRPSD